MPLKSKKRVETAQKAFADVALAAANLRPGESVYVERDFPGGSIRFACRRATVKQASKSARQKGES